MLKYIFISQSYLTLIIYFIILGQDKDSQFKIKINFYSKVKNTFKIDFRLQEEAQVRKL